MWAEGSIKVGDSIFHYWVKHYEEPNEEYGIDGGRTSKLMLKRNCEIAYNYDRGPDAMSSGCFGRSLRSTRGILCGCS